MQPKKKLGRRGGREEVHRAHADRVERQRAEQVHRQLRVGVGEQAVVPVPPSVDGDLASR